MDEMDETLHDFIKEHYETISEFLDKAVASQEEALGEMLSGEKGMDCLWELYRMYVQRADPRQASVLERYAEAVMRLADSGKPYDSHRAYVAFSTAYENLRDSDPDRAERFHTAEQEELRKLVNSFAMTEQYERDKHIYRAGFTQDGRFVGFVWEKIYGSHGTGSCDHLCGVLRKGDENLIYFGKGINAVSALAWVKADAPHDPKPYQGTSRAFAYPAGDFAPELFITKDNEENDDVRVTFCGTHCNGTPNGLGSQFYYSHSKYYMAAELQGLWQHGTLTHVRSGGRLIPLGTELDKKDAYELSVIYKTVADNADSGNALAFCQKAVALRERFVNEETDCDELVFYARCLKQIPGREEEYVALLTNIMDRKGNAPELAWEMYGYFKSRDDRRMYDMLERYLQMDGGDAEKRMEAASILGREEQFEAERMNTFGRLEWENEYTVGHGDFDCHAYLHAYGFIVGKKMAGYVWTQRYDSGHPLDDSPFSVYRCGLVAEEYKEDSTLETKVPDVICGVRYKVGGTFAEPFGKIPDDLLVETDADGRATFCGMQRDGVRHGLGIEFHFEDGILRSVRQGYWQHGILTHELHDDRLITIDF